MVQAVPGFARDRISVWCVYLTQTALKADLALKPTASLMARIGPRDTGRRRRRPAIAMYQLSIQKFHKVVAGVCAEMWKIEWPRSRASIMVEARS